jgi:hypothetical protein
MLWSDGLTIDYAQNQTVGLGSAVPRTTVPTTTSTPTTTPGPTAASPTTTTDVSGSPGGPRVAPPPSTPASTPFADWLAQFYADNGLKGSDGGNGPTASDIAYWGAVDPSGIAAGSYDYVASKMLPAGQTAVMPGGTGRPLGGPTPNGITQSPYSPAPTSGNAPVEGTGGGTGSGAFSYPSWNEQFTYAPWTQTFTPPTAITEQNDPGYQARLQAADAGLQNQEAAQGTLLTTGALKDYGAYNQTFASNEYSNVYGRALTDYQTALQSYQQNYNTAAQQYNQSYQQYLNGYNQAYQSYMGNFGVSNTLNNQNFAQQFDMASLGLSGVNSANSAAGAFGANSGNNAYNAGNANAAGVVGSTNAQNQGIANLTNTALPGLYGSPYNNPYTNPYGGTQSSYQSPYSSFTSQTTGAY